MKSRNALKTSWTDALEKSEAPCDASLREHLLEAHRLHPGFTEGCATKCKDAEGRTSYEWLCDVVEPSCHRRMLDLACGSGYLLSLCRDRFPDAQTLTGIDMSAAELRLAEERLAGEGVLLIEGLAQDLSFADDATLDAVLCHWALTLMNPVEPVLREVERVLATGGVFAAVVDGDPMDAPGYAEINDLVFKYVSKELPNYGDLSLGDPRTRDPQSLEKLARTVFKTAEVRTERSVFVLEGPKHEIAEEAVGFFYAAFILPPDARARLLKEVEAMFAETADDAAVFSLPVCRLVVTPA
ncbi:MAG: class I SAM-dependent methyltransferase [Pseudomonadota bacterium]